MSTTKATKGTKDRFVFFVFFVFEVCYYRTTSMRCRQKGTPSHTAASW